MVLRHAGSVALAITLAGTALAFALPWRSAPTPGGAQLERYEPNGPAYSRLAVLRAGSGRIVGWQTINRTRAPTVLTLEELRPTFQDAIRAFYDIRAVTPKSRRDIRRGRAAIRHRLANVQIVQSRRNILDRADPAQLGSGTLSVLLRERRGLLLIGQIDETPLAATDEVVIDPPALLMPAGLDPGTRWSSRGRFGGEPYVLTGSAGPRHEYRGPLGAFDDCLTIDTRLTIGMGAAQQEGRSLDQYCAGVGLVESRALNPADELMGSTVTIAIDGRGPRANAPPSVAIPDRASFGDPGGWRLELRGRRYGRALGSSTFAPVYLRGGDPPLVLFGTQTGELLAVEADPLQGLPVWRFHAGGLILGEPVVDRRAGRIYFGSTDKRLYALDARGLFLWSHRTGDNVATRPAVAGGTVIFGSEDRSVYSVDADTGARRWQTGTGGPVVSSPVIAGSIVAIGSDDGSVYGLELKTGEKRWRRRLGGGAVEAPIVARAGTVYAVSRRGVVAALRSRDGAVRWKRTIPKTLRTAPVLAGDVLIVVSEEGSLTAVDRRTGRRRWSLRDRDLVGPAIVVAGQVVVAAQDGVVRLLDLAGHERRRWRAEPPAGSSPLEGRLGSRPGFTFRARPGFVFGPTLGGGSAWLGDESVVFRLGDAP